MDVGFLGGPIPYEGFVGWVEIVRLGSDLPLPGALGFVDHVVVGRRDAALWEEDWA